MLKISSRDRRTAGGDIASTQGHAAFCTDEIETTEIVAFAEWGLLAVGEIDGKEL